MRRREFITLLSRAAAGWPLAARAQRPTMPVIGFLTADRPVLVQTFLTQFRRGLGEARFVEGDTVVIVYRWAEDRFDRLPALAGELVQRNVSLIFVGGGDIAALAVKSATATIPIVFAIGADPVQQGIVASLNRPGGNITGATFSGRDQAKNGGANVRDLMPTDKIAVLGNPTLFEQLLNDVVETGGGELVWTSVSSEPVATAKSKSLSRHSIRRRSTHFRLLSDPVYIEPARTDRAIAKVAQDPGHFWLARERSRWRSDELRSKH